MANLKYILEPYSAIIITGGSSGIGKAFIDFIRKCNAKVFVFNLSRTIPESFSQDEYFKHFTCDLESREQIHATVRDLLSEISNKSPKGKIMLINNSGFGSYGYFPEPDANHQASMVSVNAVAPVLLTALLLPQLKQSGGSIINIASTSAFQPTPYMATYGASKIFLLHWSMALNQELKQNHIPVLAVCPGPTSTAFFKRAGFRESVLDGSWKGLTVDDVVRTSLNALAGKKSYVVCGFNNKLLAFFSSSLPRAFSAWLARIILNIFRLKQYEQNKKFNNTGE